MTGDDLIEAVSGDMSWPDASRVKALLLLALDPPAVQDGRMSVQSAADASRRLSALGQRLRIPGAGLLEAAIASTASVPDLVRTKEAAKALAARAEQDDDREAALLLYHVAVAAAFCRHGFEISSRPVTACREVYDRFARRFEGFALGDLFGRAVDRIDRATPSL